MEGSLPPSPGDLPSPGPSDGRVDHDGAGDLGSSAGDTYDWYTRARALHEAGHAAQAAQLLERALTHDPGVPSLLEAAARAHFDAGHHDAACSRFAQVVALRPDDDYAHYGLGMALWRTQQFARAAEHLAMASVMRPDRESYTVALRQVRATLRARRDAGLPIDGTTS